LARARTLGLHPRFGVTHTWIVDLASRTIEEYALSGEVYRARSVTGYDEPFRPEALPGFEFTLSVVALPDGP
jgi:hypothetical protein